MDPFTHALIGAAAARPFFPEPEGRRSSDRLACAKASSRPDVLDTDAEGDPVSWVDLVSDRRASLLRMWSDLWSH